MMLREELGREATPSAVSIAGRPRDSQSIKKAPFVSEDTGIDGNKKINGRKRHILTDTIGLVWVAVVHAAHLQDGVMAEHVVSPVLGYLHRLKKVFADMAYRVDLGNWLEQAKAMVEAAAALRIRQASKKGESQSATAQKKKMKKAMDLWMKDFLYIARFVAKDDMQQLEALGLVVPG